MPSRMKHVHMDELDPTMCTNRRCARIISNIYTIHFLQYLGMIRQYLDSHILNNHILVKHIAWHMVVQSPFATWTNGC
jgi:glycogen synthase